MNKLEIVGWMDLRTCTQVYRIVYKKKPVYIVFIHKSSIKCNGKTGTTIIIIFASLTQEKELQFIRWFVLIP